MANTDGFGQAASSAKMTAAGAALASLVPPLFLEARIHAGGQGQALGDHLITQLGISMPAAENMDIAIFTRTSGAAFVVGIGSFVAYKLLHRLINSNCLWATLEQMSPEREEQQPTTATAQAERPVELTEGFYAVRLGGENELLRRLDECLRENDAKGTKHGGVAVVKVRQANALRQLYRRNHRIRRAGIAAFDQQCSRGSELGEQPPFADEVASRSDILRLEGGEMGERSSGRRKGRVGGAEWAAHIRPRRWTTVERGAARDEDEQSLSGLSDLTSASRIAPNPRNTLAPQLPDQFPDDECCDNTPPAGQHHHHHRRRSDSASTSAASSSTRKSASLHLWGGDNELCWENEFSSAGSECSTHIGEEGEERMDLAEDDDEYGYELDGGGECGRGLFLFREREGSLGGLSQMSAMKNLERMFSQDWHQELVERGKEQHGGTDNLLDNALENLRGMDRLDDTQRQSTSSMRELMEAKGANGEGEEEEESELIPNNIFNNDANFPFTAYRFFVQNSDVEPSDISSHCSATPRGMSSHHSSSPGRHKMTNKKRKTTPNTSSQGLWELTSVSGAEHGPYSRKKAEKPSQQEGGTGADNEGVEGMLAAPVMFDSVISSHSHSSSLASISAAATAPQCQARTDGLPAASAMLATPSAGGVMYDSAICTDFQSNAGDEEQMENCGTSSLHSPMDEKREEEGAGAQTAQKSGGGIIRRYGAVMDGHAPPLPLVKIAELHSTPPTRRQHKHQREHDDDADGRAETPSTLSSSGAVARPPSSVQGSERSLEWF